MTRDQENEAIVDANLRALAAVSAKAPDANEAHRIWLRAELLRAARREEKATAPIDLGISVVLASSAAIGAVLAAANWPLLVGADPVLALGVLLGFIAIGSIAIAAGWRRVAGA